MNKRGKRNRLTEANSNKDTGGVSGGFIAPKCNNKITTSSSTKRLREISEEEEMIDVDKPVFLISSTSSSPSCNSDAEEDDLFELEIEAKEVEILGMKQSDGTRSSSIGRNKSATTTTFHGRKNNGSDDGVVQSKRNKQRRQGDSGNDLILLQADEPSQMEQDHLRLLRTMAGSASVRFCKKKSGDGRNTSSTSSCVVCGEEGLDPRYSMYTLLSCEEKKSSTTATSRGVSPTATTATPKQCSMCFECFLGHWCDQMMILHEELTNEDEEEAAGDTATTTSTTAGGDPSSSACIPQLRSQSRSSKRCRCFSCLGRAQRCWQDVAGDKKWYCGGCWAMWEAQQRGKSPGIGRRKPEDSQEGKTETSDSSVRPVPLPPETSQQSSSPKLVGSMLACPVCNSQISSWELETSLLPARLAYKNTYIPQQEQRQRSLESTITGQEEGHFSSSEHKEGEGRENDDDNNDSNNNRRRRRSVKTEKDAQRFLEWYKEQELADHLGNDQTVVSCPGKDCNYCVEVCVERGSDGRPTHPFLLACGNRASCGLTSCARCRASPFHYGASSCEEAATMKAEFEAVVQKLTPANLKEREERIAAHNQLLADEQWKVANCACCPNCGKLAQKGSGCDSMKCGYTESGGGGGGCGHSFNWSIVRQSHPYRSVVAPLPQNIDVERYLNSQTDWRGLLGEENGYNLCAGGCGIPITRGTYFECGNCPPQSHTLYCVKCLPSLLENHPKDHFFKVHS